jgi:hypothetical protein
VNFSITKRTLLFRILGDCLDYCFISPRNLLLEIIEIKVGNDHGSDSPDKRAIYVVTPRDLRKTIMISN